MVQIKGLLNEKREQRDFLADYLDQLNEFQFKIKHYQGNKDDLSIQNTDLWIECYIEMFPDLQEFRNLVRSEMNRLDIEKHPDYAYDKKFNHFYYSNMRKLEELQQSF